MLLPLPRQASNTQDQIGGNVRRMLCYCLGALGGLVLLASSAAAQTHSVTVGFTPSKDTNNTLIYRQTATCPANVTSTAGFTKLTASPITTTSFTDSTVNAATTYCYVATATLNGQESVPSNAAQAQVPVSPPTGLSITSVTATVTGNNEVILAKWSDPSGTQQHFSFTDGTLFRGQGLTSSANGSFAETLTVPAGTPITFLVCNAVGQCAIQKAM